jgi:SAM-dependent methyltransferase
MKMAAAEIRERWPDVVESFADLAPSYEMMGRNITAMRENTKAYYKWIADVLRPHLGRRTMELGAGPGLLTSHLSGCEYYLITEMWEPFLAELREIAAGRAEIEVQFLDVTDLPAKREHLRSRELDSIFSTNVLEHIEDDITIMADMAGVIRPGGRVINLVPAYRSLYGEVDRAIGHYRRYEVAELRAKMEAAGLIVEKVMTFNQAGVFGWYFVNRILARSNASGDQYALFDRLVPIFRLWERIVPIPLGLSLIGIGRTGKPGT